MAMISLWCATSYLLRSNRRPVASLITALPATFMSAVSMTYILMATEGFRLPLAISYPIGAAFALACFATYLVFAVRISKKTTYCSLKLNAKKNASPFNLDWEAFFVCLFQCANHKSTAIEVLFAFFFHFQVVKHFYVKFVSAQRNQFFKIPVWTFFIT